MGMTNQSDSDDSSDGSGTNTGTVVRGTSKKGSSSNGTTQFSTVVITTANLSASGESGTMKVGSNSDSTYVPPFLSQFNQPTKSNPKYATISTDELRKMVQELDSKMEKEIDTIRTKYTKQRKDVEASIRRKKSMK